MKPISQQSHNYRRQAFASWIMIGLTCVVALIPGIGFVTWLIGLPILLITFILGIVVLSKNGTTQGILIMLASLIIAPLFIAFGPIITTGAGHLIVEAAESEKGASSSGGTSVEPLELATEQNSPEQLAEESDLGDPVPAGGKIMEDETTR